MLVEDTIVMSEETDDLQSDDAYGQAGDGSAGTDDLEKQIAEANDLAEREGIDPEVAWERLRNQDNGGDDKTTTQVETTENPVETKTDDTELNADSKVDDGKTIDYKAEVEAVKKQYENLQKLMGRQTEELGQLRQIRDRVNPLIEQLNNPDFQRHVFEYPGFNPQQKVTPPPNQQSPQYDPYDPNSVQQFINAQVGTTVNNILAQRAAKEQQIRRVQSQQQMMSNFNNAVKNARDKLIAQGENEDDVNSYIAHFGERLTGGDIIDMAKKAKNYDRDIAEAEKRGRESAIQDIKKKNVETPVRTANATGKQPTETQNSTDFSTMSPDKLNEYANTLRPGSVEWNRVMRHMNDMARRGL